MPTDDSPGDVQEIVVQKAKNGQPTQLVINKKSQRSKKKRLNPLEELGRKLGISRSTIYLYARQHKIPCVRVGHRYVLPDDAEQRIMALAYENWPPSDEKPPRQRKTGPDSENNS
jgi:excisionase family DNA binding protein